ncbi:37481_t:CDS:2 [Gigaspora margarita]|uniref:37481_t:CDS:1 n=1 Tax=Gigaspora margarita TaxID=4874 RepID=A0ABN7VV46_GIGMA|nr:37481_t:CDS:2 [Gigaspora margarita]
MNPITGLLYISNTIFKGIDDMCKKYLISNSLNSNYNLGFLEDDYEELQILLGIALEDCNEGSINEIWEVKHIQSTTNHSQFVVLLDNSLHYCTCFYLIYAGFYSEEDLVAFNNSQESFIQVVQE